ncbi:MAG: universal stress protein [Gemmatimonadetes bacterium]|nr:universal stress protein [Gemmatimonadota bacterium]
MRHRIDDLGTVVVGLESAAGAASAVHLGWRLAQAAKATLRVVSAVSDPIVDVVTAGVGLDAASHHEGLIARRRAELTTALDPIVPSEVLNAVITVDLGRAEQVIAHQAHRFDAALVVLAGAFPSGGERPAGVARHLLRTLKRPVVLSGPRAGDIGRVVAAVDVSFAAEPTFRFAADLSRLLGTEFEVVHVVAHPDVPVEWAGSPHAAEGLADSGVRAATEMMTTLLSEDVPRRISRGEVLATLRAEAEDDAGALLVVGDQGRGWIHRRIVGSTTEALLTECSAALAVLPLVRPDPT